VDPSGHVVEIMGYTYNANPSCYFWSYGFSGGSDFWQLWKAYSELRNTKIASNVCDEVEKSTTIVHIQFGDPGNPNWIGGYNDVTHEINLEQGIKYDLPKTICSIAHELKHSYDSILQSNISSNVPQDSFERIKYQDRVWREWSAHKFAGDVDSEMGFWEYWFPMDMTCYMQKLNLDVSYSDYEKACRRYFSVWGASEYRGMEKYFRDQGLLTLTEDDYNNR
jgi:hypothetical protein